MSNSFTFDRDSDFSLESNFVSALCEVIDTPRALTVFLLLKNNEYSQLVDLEIDPNHYSTAESFRDDYLVTEVLQKSPNLPLGVDRAQRALDSFYESEALCKETNDRLLFSGPVNESRVIKRARTIIADILGPLDRRSLEFIEERFSFGPGATTAIRGSGSVLSDKYDAEMHLTAELIPFYRVILGDRWWEKSQKPVIVEGNKFTTVAKNAKTDRGICIEPTLNIYVQKGVGSVLRSRLKRFGVDLNTQVTNNDLAKQAHSLGLATIDLSKASDTLAWSTVYSLLPSDWFELLDLMRCSHSKLGEEYVELEKFSSMGNGFTFELESLIFAALVLAVDPTQQPGKDFSVYGDDIILHSRLAPSLIDALSHLGFSVNESKSFLAGSFYESCGTDWFNGQPVRPFYLRGRKDKIPYALQIANALRIYSHRVNSGAFCDKRFRPLWKSLVRHIPKGWKNCRVPISLGDVGLIDVKPIGSSVYREKDGLDGWSVRYMRTKPVSLRKRSFGRILAALACPAPDIPTYGREPRRGYLRLPVPGRTTVQQWSSGLQWE